MQNLAGESSCMSIHYVDYTSQSGFCKMFWPTSLIPTGKQDIKLLNMSIIILLNFIQSQIGPIVQ